MKTLRKMIPVLVLLTTGMGLKAQLKSDIGIRLSTAGGNKIQLELRKPLNEYYSLRFGLTAGNTYGLWDDHEYLVWNDTFRVAKRTYSRVSSSYDMRFGVERKLKWNLFSVHADVLVGYQHRNLGSYFNIETSVPNGNSTYWYVNPYPFDPNYAVLDLRNGYWRAHYVSTGLALGASLDIPFYRFILGVNAQCVGNMSIPVAHDTYYDSANNFGPKDALKFNWYPSAGIALRYVLGSKKAE